MTSASTVVLITGANSGVGYATAQVLASTSAKYHVIIGSRNSDNGKKAQADLEAGGTLKGTLSNITIDVTDQHSIDAAVKQVTDRFGRLDVLINNAAIYIQDGNFQEQLEKTFRTNVVGPAMVTEAFTPLLLKSQHPHLLHISSGLGSVGLATDKTKFPYEVSAVAYRVSKAALDMLATQDIKVLGRKGVKVFAVCPGFVKSNLRGKDEESRNGGGLAGDPEESGRLIWDILEGRRDADVGKFVHKDGVYPW